MRQTLTLRDQWARLGALARLQEIERERATILAAFPGLNSRAGSATVGATLGSRPRRKMSAAARKAMSAGMRRYWARRKTAQQKSKEK
jgi:hypothetical protein